MNPKRHDYQAFSGATCITPNWKEFQQAVKLLAIRGTLEESGPALRSWLNCTALLVTQGANGMTLVTESDVHHLPALAEEVFDVSGAGDTVIATLSTALGARLTPTYCRGASQRVCERGSPSGRHDAGTVARPLRFVTI